MCEPSSNATGPVLFKLSQNLHFRPEKSYCFENYKNLTLWLGKKMFLTTFLFLLNAALA